MQNQTIGDFLKTLAAKSPVPGSSSASALSGSLGVSLGIMIVNYTINNPKYKNLELDFLKIKEVLVQINTCFLDLLKEDENAYHNFINISKLPKNEIKPFLLQSARNEISKIPKKNLNYAYVALEEIKKILIYGSPTLNGDVSTAAHMLTSCASGSVMQMIYTEMKQSDNSDSMEILEKCNKIVEEIDELAFAIIE